MRLFIAIQLPDEIKDYLYELQGKLKGPAKINFVAKKNLHCTLNFIGEVKEEKINDIKERLRKIKPEKFKLFIGNIGVFPSLEHIRVLWVGLKPQDKIIELQQRIDAELLDLFSKDERFHSHITLGRVKFVKNKEKLKEKLKIEVEDKEFEVRNFYLMKSELSKDGPKYIAIEEF